MTENAAKKQSQNTERAGAGLGVLADYGDSDDEDDEESGKNADLFTETKGDKVVIQSSLDSDADAAVKEARRARAREWAEKRRVLTSSKS